MKKRFRGRSRLFVDENGKIRDFFTTASNDGKGFKALQRKMNKDRDYNPEAIIPGLEVSEVPKTPHAP